MMEWHVNDLSLGGQFSDSQSFCEILKGLIRLRHNNPTVRSQLYCSRLLHSRHVTPTIDFRQAVLATRDRDLKISVLEWITKSGPFWDDNRQHNRDDYFEYQSHDVTDQGLGEASRRKLVGIPAGVFSFQGSPLHFAENSLLVQQGLSEAPIDSIDIANCWTIEQLIQSIQNSKTYYRWQDVRVEIQHRFEGLIIPDNVMDSLLPAPFSQQVMKRIFELLHVLDQLVIQSDDNGELSQSGVNLLQEHFTGNKA